MFLIPDGIKTFFIPLTIFKSVQLLYRITLFKPYGREKNNKSTSHISYIIQSTFKS